ncbi:uncharacterized protein PAC_10118 [Phialocephala subalpina]|uniref:JmjC domain-containing protein n=1 Tax=Phialocephala subalpina TaxID=576137 RepID=A0A1L7X5C6_9HELO|nr:uncharacterized protein PAC_10118 [Phialocephala subalpina]
MAETAVGANLDPVTIDAMRKRDTNPGSDVKFLQQIWDRQMDGVVLVEKVDFSPYKNLTPVNAKSCSTPLELERYKPSKVSDGVFTLHIASKLAIEYDEIWIEKAVAGAPTQQLDMIDVMEADETFGIQTAQIFCKLYLAIATSFLPTNFKKIFEAKEFPAQSFFISTAGSPISVRSSAIDFAEMYYHHGGESRVWYMIPPSQQPEFEDRIRQEMQHKIPAQRCSQFVRHFLLWLSPNRVRRWGFNVVEFEQTAGQLLFIMPHTYYWGYSKGYSVVEQMYIAHKDWTPRSYNFCLLYVTRSICLQYDHATIFGSSATSAQIRKFAELRGYVAEPDAPESDTPEPDFSEPAESAAGPSQRPSRKRAKDDIEDDSDIHDEYEHDRTGHGIIQPPSPTKKTRFNEDIKSTRTDEQIELEKGSAKNDDNTASVVSTRTEKHPALKGGLEKAGVVLGDEDADCVLIDDNSSTPSRRADDILNDNNASSPTEKPQEPVALQETFAVADADFGKDIEQIRKERDEERKRRLLSDEKCEELEAANKALETEKKTLEGIVSEMEVEMARLRSLLKKSHITE